MDDLTAVKTCRRCNLTKPLDAFHRMKASPDGRQYRCRTCALEVAKASDLLNRDRRYEAARRRYAEDPEAHRDRLRAWRKANPELLQAQRLRYDDRHPGQTAEAIKRWFEANPDRRAAYDRARRARVAGATIGAVDFDELWTGFCGICGSEMDRFVKHPDPLSPSIDHIIPLVLGGSHEQSNLQWSHLYCNVRKGARPTA